jgi:transcriptional regulator with XRE-family HTH domain
MDSDQDIARRLIAIRDHFGLSQVAFARGLNIAKNTLNGYETSSRSLTLETAKRIHRRYGISIDWLLFGAIGQPSHELVVKFGSLPRISTDKPEPTSPIVRRKA